MGICNECGGMGKVMDDDTFSFKPCPACTPKVEAPAVGMAKHPALKADIQFDFGGAKQNSDVQILFDKMYANLVFAVGAKEMATKGVIVEFLTGLGKLYLHMTSLNNTVPAKMEEALCQIYAVMHMVSFAGGKDVPGSFSSLASAVFAALCATLNVDFRFNEQNFKLGDNPPPDIPV